MNPASKLFFEKHLKVLHKEYDEIKQQIETYTEKQGIKSHTLGDKKYYELYIQKWEKYRQIKMTKAILEEKEWTYVRNDIPFVTGKINFCKGMINDLAIRGDNL